MQVKDNSLGKEEIFDLIRNNPGCFLATCDDDAPHVRGILIYRADEQGIIFHTGKSKDLYQQLCKNPKVELCFTNGNLQDLVQVRVSGSVELVEDMALKVQIVAERDFLKPWVEQRGYDAFAVFRLNDGRATVWTMATNFVDKTWIEF